MHISKLLILFLMQLVTALYAWPQATKVLNIDQAYKLFTANDFTLKARNVRVQGLEGLIQQAKLFPNPQLTVESENFGGSRSGFQETENTLLVSQKLELGNKRHIRTVLAKSKLELHNAISKLKKANLIRDLKIAYSHVVMSESLFKLSKEHERFASRMLVTAKEKISHGGVLFIDKTKAELSLHLASIDSKKARSRLEQSKQALASYWNGAAVDVGVLEPLPDNSSVKFEIPHKLETTLALRAHMAKAEVSHHGLKREQAHAMPDLNIAGGYRRFEETNDDALVASVSVSIPIFDTNQGQILQARREVEANELEYKRSKVSLETRLTNINKAREVLQEERLTIVNYLLPGSNQVLNEIREAYKLGRVTYLELAAAQQEYFRARERLINNTFALKKNEANIKAITGEILDDFEQNN